MNLHCRFPLLLVTWRCKTWTWRLEKLGQKQSMSRIDSWHQKISTCHHFQNGRHNTTQIQHCSISTSWFDYRHRKISTGLHFQNGRHNTAKIQHCLISKVAFNLFFKPVVSGRFGRAILKMATGRNFSMSEHHYLPTYQILISDQVEFLPPIIYAVFWQPFWKWQTSPKHMNLSTADLGNYWTEFHETWWSYRYMFLVGPKVFSFVVKGAKIVFWGLSWACVAHLSFCSEET
jgi:hypothetical protein